MVSFKAKAITPNIPTNPKSFANDIRRAAKLTSQQIKRDFEKTVRTWTKKPEFVVSQKKIGNSYTFVAYTDNQIYIYVNDGTKPHTIRAKNVPNLVFSYPTTAKTTPRVLGSKSGSRGSKWATVPSVQHPGTEARKFDEIIQKRFKDRWQKEANRILRNYLDRQMRLK